MTRDEAIEIEIKKLNKLSAFHPRSMLRDVATANIDALIELGLLKVAEPLTDMVHRERALLNKLGAGHCSPNDLHNYCQSVGIGLIKL